jgi:hypothetical protein
VKKLRTTPSIILNNRNDSQNFPLDSGYFANCIIDGSNSDEITLDSAAVAGQFNNVVFTNSMLKTQMNTSNVNRFINIKLNQYPNFIDASIKNFKLNASSPAVNFGLVLPFYTNDINGVLRDASPDLGAYEYVP